MGPAELKKSISGNKIHPLYFFYGANTRLIDESIDSISSCLFTSQSSEFDLDYFDAQEHAPSEITLSARTPPFFSARRLVVVKRAHAFKEAQWKNFQSYFMKPASSCCLVFIAESRSLKGKLLNIFQKSGVLVSFENPRGEKQIKELIISELRRAGKSITPDALNYFAVNTNGDAQSIASETGKISLFCRDKSAVDVEDLEEILSEGYTSTIFNLVDAIGLGNIEKSFKYLNNLLSEGVYPLVILKMIARQFRLISRARAGISRGDSVPAIGKNLNLRFDNLIKGVMVQARGWSIESLGMAFEEIFQSNFLIKSSKKENKIILESLVFKLAGLHN